MKCSSLLIVVSGPSGTGKGTVIKALREISPNITVLPSVTTRSPRKGEKEGYSYYFSTREEFKNMIERDEFVEWVEYCDNYYGTLRKQLEDSLKSGNDTVLEKEVKGAIKIKEQYPDCVSIFLLPPNFEELKRRIEGRGTEEVSIIEKRLNIALEEMSYINKYDYVIINDCIKSTVKAISCIIKAEKLKTGRNLDILKGIVL